MLFRAMPFSCGFVLLALNWVMGDSSNVVCYTAFWSRYLPEPMNYKPTDAPGNLCNILVYAFMTVNASTYEIEHRDPNADISQGGLRQAVMLKQKNPNLKVILSVGGIPHEGLGEVIHYSNMMRVGTRRSAFANSTLKIINEYGFDGLELHWYYPGSDKGTPEDKVNYYRLVRDLRQTFGPKLTLMITGPFLRKDIDAGFKVSELVKHLDYINVRTIDMNVYDQNVADNSSPLRRRSFDNAGTQNGEQNVVDVLEIYTALGAPREKLIFGIPFQNHVFVLEKLVDDHFRAPAKRDHNPAPITKDTSVFFHYETCASIMTGKWIEKRHRESGIPYAVNPETSQWVSYEDERTITEKVQYAKQGGFGGVFVWLMEHDDFRGLCGEKHSLLNTINRAMNSETPTA